MTRINTLSASLPLLAVLLAAAFPATAGLLPEMPKLPEIAAVTAERPMIPLRVYSADNVLLGQFGADRGQFVPAARMPALLKRAVLAMHDRRFYDHGAIDWSAAYDAAKLDPTDVKGSWRQGVATLSMALARNYYLMRDEPLPGALQEVALAYRIEHALSKDRIFEVYLNQIHLGQRAYGFPSAAQSYFGKPLASLSVAEIAMLAGLAQDPAGANPFASPSAARERQRAALARLRAEGIIDAAGQRQALAEPLRLRRESAAPNASAAHVVEMAHQAALERLGQAAYEQGVRVITTIRAAEQEAAYAALRRQVLAHDRRQGYRGPETRIDLPPPQDTAQREAAIAFALRQRIAVPGLVAAVVLDATPKLVRASIAGGETIEVSGAGLALAARALGPSAKPDLKLAPGAVIRLARPARSGAGLETWSIAQLPEVAAAFVALDAETGAYRALVGGFDAQLKPFNHATQGWRPAGSNLAPFIYSAGLERRVFPATLIQDKPLDLSGEPAYAGWSPRNDDGRFDGDMTVRQAFAQGRSVATVRLARAIEVGYTHDFLQRFGFESRRHPRNLTLATGAGNVTPLQMAGAYAVLANGGYRIEPYLVARIENCDGKILMEHKRVQPRQESARVLPERNAFIVDSMLRDAARSSGAAQASQLRRADLAGKLGASSNSADGWFAGYGGANGNAVVGVAWMGYPEARAPGAAKPATPLALPIWIDPMRVALAKAPQRPTAPPRGVVRADGDWIYAEAIKPAAPAMAQAQ